jgi:hypothetical protein
MPVTGLRMMIGSLIRAAPGGASFLRLRRRSIAAARRRVYPVRPPLHSPEHVAALSEVARDHPFISGNGIAASCRYVINYDDLTVNEDVDNQWWFCRTDFVEYFFSNHEPRHVYVLFSHNSDRPVDESLARFLHRRRLRMWFASNAGVRHPKLHALPLGVANPRWRHGDGTTLLRVQNEVAPKAKLFDASYDISTYPPAREYCRDQTGIEPSPRRDFDEYLRALASSYFCIAPRGNGIDTHRIWEALYVRTIPIVTSSVVADQHADLPIVVLKDWAEFCAHDFSPRTYDGLMSDWNPDVLLLDRYLTRINSIIAAGGNSDA